MSSDARVKAYNSQVADYHDAFQVFLDHTDQKVRANAWLERFVKGLPARGVFIDAGAGEGTLTELLMPHFARTIAIEPNASLRESLARRCATATVLGDMILAAQPAAAGDFILCSHVFYYLPAAEWLPSLERLASWLSPAGTLVILLQNSGTDCMKMFRHFFGHRFDLAGLVQRFEQAHGDRYSARIETDPATIQTRDFASAYTVAEFMLNLLPLTNPPLRRELEAYVENNFRDPATQGYRFSCDQDFLQVRRK
jgi:hypothetical protein